MDDGLESAGAGDRIPAAHRVVVLGTQCGGASDQHHDDRAVPKHELAEAVARLAP